MSLLVPSIEHLLHTHQVSKLGKLAANVSGYKHVMMKKTAF